MSLPLVLVAALVAALELGAAAQEPAPPAPPVPVPPPPPRVVVAAPAPLPAPMKLEMPELPAATPQDARLAAILWLRGCQRPDGSWDGDAFLGAGVRCEGPAQSLGDVGVTSLALLALLADGSTMRVGPHQDAIKRAVLWLRDSMQADGRVGTTSLEQALATMAFAETYRLSNYKLLHKYVQGMVAALEAQRDERGAWPGPTVETTAWALLARTQAAATHVAVPPHPSAFGRAVVRELPPAPAALAHAALILGEEPDPARAVAQALPQWKPERIDFVGWWHAVHVVPTRGEGPWREWRQALVATALQAQRIDGDYAGSFDPLGGDLGGGRVATTALMAATLADAERQAGDK